MPFLPLRSSLHRSCPHTADEVWRHIPAVELETVQLADLPTVDETLKDDSLEQKWSEFAAIRDEIFKALESARKEKVIGNSLGAKVDIFPSKDVNDKLKAFESQLETLLIVSKVVLHTPDEQPDSDVHELEGLSVKVSPATGEKCERCWNVTEDVGSDAAHPTICARCAEVLQ